VTDTTHTERRTLDRGSAGSGDTRSDFSPEQVERLLRPIRPARVYQTQGQSNVAGWDIRAHLTRMFGFGNWEKQILELDLVSEIPVEKNGRTGWYVTYRCVMQLRVYAATYALKRCAIDLGDQFGLSLYAKGQTAAVVGMTLVGMHGEEPDLVVDGDDHDPDSVTRPSVVPDDTSEGSSQGEPLVGVVPAGTQRPGDLPPGTETRLRAEAVAKKAAQSGPLTKEKP
jgi:hypothetical protein